MADEALAFSTCWGTRFPSGEPSTCDFPSNTKISTPPHTHKHTPDAQHSKVLQAEPHEKRREPRPAEECQEKENVGHQLGSATAVQPSAATAIDLQRGIGPEESWAVQHWLVREIVVKANKNSKTESATPNLSGRAAASRPISVWFPMLWSRTTIFNVCE